MDIEEIKSYKNDHLARFLIDDMRFTPIRFALITLLISLLYSLALSLSATGPDYFLTNPISLIWVFVFAPCIGIFYLWGSKAIDDLIRDLERPDVMDLKEINKFLNVYQHPLRKILSIFIALILSIIFFILTYMRESFLGIVWINPLIGHTISFVVGSYMVIMIVFALITNIWILDRIFQGKNLKIAHPGKSGGLHALSGYSLKTAYLAAVFAIMIILFINRYGDLV